MLGLRKLFQGHGPNPCKCLSLSQKQTVGLMEAWKKQELWVLGRGWASSPQCTLGRRVSLPFRTSTGNSTSLCESDPHGSNVLCSSKPEEIWPEPATF